LYVIEKEAGVESTVQVVDIDPPESASVVYSFAADVEAEGIDVEGGYLYITGYDHDTGGNKLIIFDNGNPKLPEKVKTVGISVAGQIDVSGGFAYIAGEFYLEIIDIDPLQTAYLLKMFHAESWEEFLDVAVSGEYAYVITGDSRILMLDIEPQSSAFIMRQWGCSKTPPRIETQGDYLYAGGFSIFELP
jgi:hypothetical protein